MLKHASHHTTTHMRRGSKGKAVSLVQHELKRRLVPELRIDGDFGSDTQEAVRLFQRSIGFKGNKINGEMNPRTTLALSQTFHLKMRGRVAFDLKQLTIPSLLTLPKEPENRKKLLLSANFQLGLQKSWRDGLGYQISAAGTLKTNNYISNANESMVYHEAHGEMLPGFNLGLPFPRPSNGVVTGQFNLTLQPITDWLVIGQAQLQFLDKTKVHLLTPSVAFNYQLPIGNYPNRKNDPATLQRIGGSFGLELAHVDLPAGLSLGVSGAEAFYWDHKGGKAHWDPSVMGFAQWSYDIIK